MNGCYVNAPGILTSLRVQYMHQFITRDELYLEFSCSVWWTKGSLKVQSQQLGMQQMAYSFKQMLGSVLGKRSHVWENIFLLWSKGKRSRSIHGYTAHTHWNKNKEYWKVLSSNWKWNSDFLSDSISSYQKGFWSYKTIERTSWIMMAITWIKRICWLNDLITSVATFPADVRKDKIPCIWKPAKNWCHK